MSELDDIREEMVQFWGQMAPYWAISPAAARLHAFLMSREEAVDTDTVMAELGMSRGAVSMGLRELREWGLVLQEKPGGSRRVLYRAETDWETAIRAIAENRRRREWGPIERRAEDWAERLKGQRSGDAKALRDRLLGVQALVGAANEATDALLSGKTAKGIGMRFLLSRVMKRQGRRR